MRNAPAVELDIGGRGLEKMPGERAALLDHLRRRLDQRLAARHDRARAAGAAADQELVAVALDQIDQLERQAEAVDQHLRERRGVALAVVERAGDDRHPAVRLEADAAHLRIRRRGHLEIAGKPAAAQLAAWLSRPAGAPRTRPSRRARGRRPGPRRNRRCRTPARRAPGTESRSFGIRFCRRSAAGSRPVSRAAGSTSRSIT